MTSNKEYTARHSCANNICDKDISLFYGLPGVAILIQSMFPTFIVSTDFPNDALIKLVTYIAFCLLFGLTYCIFQAQLQELAPHIPLLDRFIEAVRKRIVCDTIYNNECSSETEQNVSPKPVIEQIESTIAPRTDAYELRKTEADKLRELHKTALRKAIGYYIYHEISPFAKESEVAIVHNEIMAWMDDYTYTPNPIILSGRKDILGIKTERLTSTDLRHFIWNIAKRLGDPDKYTGQIMAVFAKTPFPDEFALTEIDSIRNFTVSPNSGFIHIDKPEPNGFEFHYGNTDAIEK